MLGNELMAVGDPVYKLSTDENWPVVIPIDAQRGAQIQQEDYVKVRFRRTSMNPGAGEAVHRSDGNTFISYLTTMVNVCIRSVSDTELI